MKDKIREWCNMLMRDKVRGLFIGTAIGDSLGMCCETWSKDKISQTYGRVTDYLVPDGHKWFNGHKAGTYTDDTQLTMAVAEGLIESNLDMEAQVKYHVEALKTTDAGWGHTTRDSIRRLANGIHWSKSGTGENGTGTGNGVPMKISPMGVYLASTNYKRNEIEFKETIDFIVKLNLMTHKTSISASAAMAHSFAVLNCISCKELNTALFGMGVIVASRLGEEVCPETLTDRITDRLNDLFNNIQDYDEDRLIKEFGGGSCYCYNSLPFTYGFFLKNPNSIESLYDVINAGGDTDSNGSMLGGLLGALHGTSIFPEHLINGVLDKDKIFDVADRLYEKLFTE